MKRIAFAATAMAATALAAAADYVVRPEGSELSFVYRQMGVPVEGRFRRFDARIDFDPARPSAGKAEIGVDVASIDTGFAEADREVAGKDWFDAATYPRAKFVAATVRPLGGNRYEAAGTLTIRGRTRQASAPFTFTPSENGATFEGAFVIKRGEFGIGQGAWADFDTVANEVQVRFRLRAAAARPR